MAVKALFTTTIYKSIDIANTKLYYKLVNAGSTAPDKPTTLNPSGWSTTEPTFDISKDLYATMETIYSDNSFTYSDVTKYSSYEAAKQAYNTATNAQTTANTANTNATNITNRVNDKENHFNFKYYTDVRVYGDVDKFYPVIIKAGDQNVKRTILVKRGYNESAPAEWNKSTHPGALTLKILCNFGGWGGATYSWEISEFQEQYSNIFGGASNCGNNCMFAIFLRGGGTNGAIYHLYSDQSLTANIYNYGWDSSISKYRANMLPAPQISYRTDYVQYKSDLCFGTPGNKTQNPAGSGYYDDLQYKVDAPAPRAMVANGTTEGGFTKYVRTASQNEEIRIRNYVLLTQNNDTRLNDTILAVDGKIESYYQSTNPANSWSTNVEKEKHIGDIWYNTTNQKTFVYYKNNTNPVTYEWKWQNVPTELIDSVNGKATIYSGVIPSNYSVGDYWLIPLNCYTNTYSLTSQTGEYSVNQTIKLDRYTLTVTGINSSTHAITSYTVNVPSNSNYSLAETISDGMLTLTISSNASFTLPTGCYGGSMCVTTTAGTSYNASHWVKRNDYTPKDKTDTYATEVNLNDNVLGLNGSINSNYTDLEGQINDTYITLNGKIDDNYSDLSGVINSNVGGLDSRTSSLEDYRDTFSRTYASDNSNIIAREVALEDRLVKTIQSTSGGSNLLRNSVGFRGTKYWTSPSSGIIEQSFSTVPQQTITVNFKWKKPTSNPATITLGYYNQSNQFVTAYTVLTTSSNVSAWSTASFTYTSNVNNPVIRFNDTFTSSQDSDAYTNGISGSKLVFGTSGLVITDLIIAYGNGQNWSPYYSELYGSTFNLDADGLDIRASLSDKHSHLDANMLAFLGAQDTVEGLFSKNETRTDNLYLTNAQYIGNLHIINIDNNNIIEY